MIIENQNLPNDNNWLNKLVLENNFCCGMCYGIFYSKLTYEASLILGRASEFSNCREFNRSKINPIERGEIFSLVMDAAKCITVIAPKDEFKYRGLVMFLTRYFSIKELHVYLKPSLLRSILIKMEIHNLKKKKSNVKTFSGRPLTHVKLRPLKKQKRDIEWREFIAFFKPIKPLEKLALILSEDLPFPYDSIPDDALFEPNLLLRRQVLERFTVEELAVLKKKFGGERKKNKRTAWSKILKVLK